MFGICICLFFLKLNWHIFVGLNDEDSLLDKMNPKTKEEFTAYKDALCKNILCFKKSEYFPSFIEELFRDLSAGRKWIHL